MQVVILCGGLGTRLRSVVNDRPKVLAPVAGRPFLHYLLDRLAREGFDDIVLSTGYMGDMVEEAVEAMELPGARVRLVREREPLGTAGALRFASESVGIDAAFGALNGDTLFSGSIRRLIDCHQRVDDARATIALVRTDDAQRYGTVELAKDSGLIYEFVEKGASRDDVGWINAGAYVLEPESLHVLNSRTGSIERDVFPRLVGQGLYGCRFPDAVFLDIGVPRDYHRAQEFLQRIDE